MRITLENNKVLLPFQMTTTLVAHFHTLSTSIFWTQLSLIYHCQYTLILFGILSVESIHGIITSVLLPIIWNLAHTTWLKVHHKIIVSYLIVQTKNRDFQRRSGIIKMVRRQILGFSKLPSTSVLKIKHTSVCTFQVFRNINNNYNSTTYKIVKNVLIKMTITAFLYPYQVVIWWQMDMEDHIRVRLHSFVACIPTV